jgi:hypothetical protein
VQNRGAALFQLRVASFQRLQALAQIDDDAQPFPQGRGRRQIVGLASRDFGAFEQAVHAGAFAGHRGHRLAAIRSSYMSPTVLMISDAAE